MFFDYRIARPAGHNLVLVSLEEAVDLYVLQNTDLSSANNPRLRLVPGVEEIYSAKGFNK